MSCVGNVLGMYNRKYDYMKPIKKDNNKFIFMIYIWI